MSLLLNLIIKLHLSLWSKSVIDHGSQKVFSSIKSGNEVLKIQFHYKLKNSFFFNRMLNLKTIAQYKQQVWSRLQKS